MNHKEFLLRIMEYYNRDITPPSEEDNDGNLDPGSAGKPKLEKFDAEDEVYPDEDEMDGMIESTSDKVLKDILNLASGTMGSLTDINKTRTLDKIQDDFWKFAKNSKENFTSWSQAWNAWGAWYPAIQNWNLSQDPTKAEYTKGNFTVVVDKKDKTWDLYKGNDNKNPIDAGKVNPEAIKGVLRGLNQIYK